MLLSYRLKKEQRESEIRQRELEITQRELEFAREIQMTLLPKETPRLDRVEIGTLYRTASQVGSDWYDLFWVSEHELSIVIADVAGKGIPGALMMVMARAIIRAKSDRAGFRDHLLPVGLGTDPASIIRKTNQMIAKDIKKGWFITANYSILNVNTLRFNFVSAGHNDTLVYNSRTGELREYNPKGIALGLDKGKLFDMLLQDQELTLSPGDLLFQYTDGVEKALNTRKEEFGKERLKEAIQKYADQSVNDFLSSLDQEIRAFTEGFPQSDDITAVVIKVVNGPSSGDPSSGSSVIEVIEDVEEIEEIEVIEDLEDGEELEELEELEDVEVIEELEKVEEVGMIEKLEKIEEVEEIEDVEEIEEVGEIEGTAESLEELEAILEEEGGGDFDYDFEEIYTESMMDSALEEDTGASLKEEETEEGATTGEIDGEKFEMLVEQNTQIIELEEDHNAQLESDCDDERNTEEGEDIEEIGTISEIEELEEARLKKGNLKRKLKRSQE